MKNFNLPVLIVLAGLLSACEHLGPEGFKKIPLDQDISLARSKASAEQKDFPQVANPSKEEREGIEKAQLYPGDGDFIGSVATPSGGGQSAAGKYTLNFEEAELGEVVKVIINDTLNASYVINPKVRGKVTLQTSRPLTREELLPTLELLLQVNNAVLIRKGNIYQIEPAASALQGGAVCSRAFPAANCLPATRSRSYRCSMSASPRYRTFSSPWSRRPRYSGPISPGTC